MSSKKIGQQSSLRESSETTDISVLIVARPDRMRDSLEILLKLMPQIEIVGRADNGDMALKLVDRHHPMLMILDTNLPEDQNWTVLKQVKMAFPQILCLVLVAVSDQRQAAEVAGADKTLLKGFRITEFFTAIEPLITKTKNDGYYYGCFSRCLSADQSG